MKTIPSIISRFLSPLSFGEGQGVRLLLLLLLASCGEQMETEQPVGDNGNRVEVTCSIDIRVLPMQSIGAATRAQGDKPVKGEAIHVSYIDESSTRGTEDVTASEATINNAYILQFDGTSSAAVLRTKVQLTAAQLTGSAPVACTLNMATGVKNRVYVVANVPSTKTLTVGTTTLAGFEGVVALAPATTLPATTLPATGLPLSACQDVSAGDVFNIFQLRSLLAKLKFTTNTGTLKLINISNGYTFSIQAQPGDNAVRPIGMTYNATGVTLTSGATYYVPENLSGRSNISSPVARISKFAPTNSTCVLISANSTTYSAYLGDGAPQDFNFTGGYFYNISSSVYGTDATDLRVGTPAITNLSALGTANCYITTAANTWYSFDGTVMGNGATTLLPVNMASTGVASPIIPQPLNPIGADVLWETWNTTTAPDKGSVVFAAYAANGTMLVRTGSEQGNAVVAARDANGTIIWSWHIWRIDTDPTLPENTATTTEYTSTEGTFDDTGTTTHPGFTMMKLNLGALSTTPGDPLANGLFYQWGRKDPFKGAASTTTHTDMVITPASAYSIAPSNSSITLAVAVKNPGIFYFGNDWTFFRNDNLWGTPLTKTVISSSYNSNKGNKSIYDPCPVGWRVPPAYVYANATVYNCPWLDPDNNSDKKGRDFKGIFNGTSVWFPASGDRGGKDYGDLVNVGNLGLYWVSSIAPTGYGHLLFFHGTSLFPNYQEYILRVGGMAIRCTKE